MGGGTSPLPFGFRPPEFFRILGLRISDLTIMASTTTADLRKLTPEQLEKLGQDSLREHLLAQAVVAHQKHGPLTFDKLDALLHDPECLRHPVRLVYEFGEMAMHQFAQPDMDWRNTEQDGRVLYVRPILRDRPDLVLLAVAYMIPQINYGDIITDEHCVAFGATLLGMMEDEFYQAICALADSVGAEIRMPGHQQQCREF
jgi:hypothetical protein